MTGDLISAECEVDVYRQQLRASRAAFHAIVDRSADGVIVLTSEGRIAFVNPAAEALLGRPAGELYGEPFGIPLRPGETSEIDLLGADGGVRVAELQVTETEWQNRSSFLVTLRDITAHIRAERRARDAVKRRDEFLALLSHELRNPLAAIRNASVVLSRCSDDPAQARSADVIDRQCHQMARLLEELLEVSRVSQGKIQLQCETLDLRDVIDEAVETVTPLIDSYRHKLDFVRPPAPIPVRGDSARLIQVFSNLLTNSARYTDPDGSIRIEFGCDSREVEVRVIDNGVGITADMLCEIFEPFVQANPGIARCDTGLGLGLALVRTLVELHGGSVKALSDGKGQGSTFCIRLPVLKCSQALQPLTPAANPERMEPIRIVLVEDNPDVRDMLQTLLELDGHEVGAAADGQSAVEMIELQRPDVAIVDIGLPVLDGYEVARRIRSNRENAGTLLVALTGYGQAEDRKRAAAAGFDAHLVKPVDLKKLYSILATQRSQPEPKSRCGEAKAEVPPRLIFIPGAGVVTHSVESETA